ncbi:hypothetical protein BJY59DRAFT_51301 [Rhodotorula toruloides]
MPLHDSTSKFKRLRTVRKHRLLGSRVRGARAARACRASGCRKQRSLRTWGSPQLAQLASSRSGTGRNQSGGCLLYQRGQGAPVGGTRCDARESEPSASPCLPSAPQTRHPRPEPAHGSRSGGKPSRFHQSLHRSFEPVHRPGGSRAHRLVQLASVRDFTHRVVSSLPRTV